MKAKQIFLLCVLLAMAAAARAQSPPNVIVCPSEINGAPPTGWSGPDAPKAAPFERISVFNRDKDGQEYDLAPDDESKKGKLIIQHWKLTDYRDLPLLVRCHYKGSDAAIARDLPPELKVCELRFRLDARGHITSGSEAECQ